jgi:hypothetical protein
MFRRKSKVVGGAKTMLSFELETLVSDFLFQIGPDQINHVFGQFVRGSRTPFG